MTREQWLLNVSKDLEELFKAKGYEITQKYRVSCSLPSKGAFGKRLRTLGQAWHSKCSEDNTCEVFISPTIADNDLVIATLAHELVHVCVGNEAGHGPAFKRCATALGLTGKMTATVAGEEMKQWIAEKNYEQYPHAVLDSSQQKKQSTRMIKVTCINPLCQHTIEFNKPYTVRMSQRTIKLGVPFCGCCETRMEESN